MALKTVRITGLEGVLEALKALPPEIVSKNGGPVRSGVRKGAVVIQKQAQANVRRIVAEPNKDGSDNYSSGELEASITVKRRKPNGGVRGEQFNVGLSKVSKKFANTVLNRRKRRVGATYKVLPATFYGYFLENGTERMVAHPWMGPAYNEKKAAALQTMVSEINAGIARAVKKLSKGKR